MSGSDVTTKMAATTTMVLMSLMVVFATVDSRIIPEQRKDTKEYCSTDAFRVSCGDQEVILMTSALYGRMQPGRCISGDYHHTVGCFTDVLTYVDSKCSGRQECMVIVGSLELVAQPCQKDFKSYLEASYKCIPVIQTHPELCQSVNHLPVPPTTDIAFGRSTVTSAGDTASSCSWGIEVNAGQQVALILSAFPEPISLHHPTSGFVDGASMQVPAPVHEPCPWEVVIHEGDRVTSVPLCAGDDRERQVYTSGGNHLAISFTGNGDVETLPYFLLGHKAVGCPDIEAPKRAWVRREKDNLVMKCNDTGETWYLTCRHGEWIGDVGNCSSGASVFPAGRSSVFDQSTIFQEGVIFAVIVGIVLGLLIGTSMLGIVFFCRKRWQLNGGSQSNLQVSDPRDQRLSTVKSSYPALLRQEKPIGGNVCEYTHVWEVRPTNMSSFKKDAEQQKLDDVYISAVTGSSTEGVSTPGICTQSMMGSHGIYEASTNQRTCEKHQLCLAHDPLYFELDADGKRTCAV